MFQPFANRRKNNPPASSTSGSNRRKKDLFGLLGRRLVYESLEDRRMLTTDMWIGGSGGDWSVGGNWNNGIPTSASNVVIPAGVSVTVSTGTQAAGTITTDPTDTLTIDGGSLTVAATSAIAGDLNLSSGTLTVSSGATLTLAGATNQWSGGTVAGSFAGSGGGTVSLASGTLNIASAGATFDFPTGMFNWSGGTIQGNGSNSVLTNNGTITLTGSANKVLFDGLTLNNSGTIDEDGTSGSNDWEFSTDVVLNNLSGGIVDMETSEFIDNISSGNEINNELGATFENTGNDTVSTGAVPFNNQGGIVAATAGTLNLTAGGTDTGGTYNASTGATVNLNNGGTAPTLTGTYSGSGGGTVGLPSGTIGIGTAGATFSFPAGLFNWSGGVIQGNGSNSVLTNTGAITLTGGVAKELFDGLTLNNSGTIDEEGTSNSNDWEFSTDVVLNNLSGGIVDMETSEFIDNISSGNEINNELGATFENTGNDTVSTGAVPFNNQGGIVAATAGTLNLTAGGTDTGGTYNASTGATVNLNNGGTAPTLTGTYSGSGGGTVGLPSGTIGIGTAGATFSFPAGLFNWSGGVIQGNGSNSVLTNTGTITLTGGGAKVLFDGLTLNNSGTIDEEGTSNSNDWEFSTSAVLDNLSGGIVDMETSEFIDNISSGNAINNEAGATFENTGSNTVSTGAVPFNNQGGIVSATAGTLNLTGGGTDTGGTYNASTNATVNLNNGGTAPTLTGTYSGSGGGTIGLPSGTIDIGAAGATFNFPTSLFNWSGGTIQGDGVGNVLTNTGTITLTGSGAKILFDGLTLNNSGTIDEDGTSGSNDWEFDSSAVLDNLSGGIVDMETSEYIDNISSGNAINNEGGATFENTGSDTVSTGLVPFNNQGGIVSATAGTLNITGGGTDTGGTFNPSTGATINLNNSGTAPTLTGTYSGSGGGTVGLPAGTIDIGTAGATFNFPTGLFNWSGGTIQGNGAGNVLTNTGTITLTSSGAKTLYDGLIVSNGGAIVDSGTDDWAFDDSAVLNNLSGGLVNMASSESIENISSGNAINNEPGATFENTGNDTISTGAVPFNNQAGATVRATLGTLNLTGGGTDTGGTFNASTGATINLNTGSGTAPTLTGTYTGSGGGTVGLPSDTIDIGAGGATFNFPAGLFNWSGGTIQGNGSNSVLTNTGTITLTGGGAKVLYDGLTLNNSGAINEDGTSGSSDWEFSTSAILNNLSAGVVDMTTSESIENISSGNAINNEAGATFENTGPGTSTGAVPFNNQAGATVAATTGTLNLTGGGTDTGGTFNASTGATINLNNGGTAPTLTGTYIGGGGGTVGLPAGTIDIGTAGATFNFPAGLFNWSGGTIQGNGSNSVLTNTGTITLTGGGAKVLFDGLTLNNSGTIDEDGTSGTNDWEFSTGAVLNNLSGGIVDMTTSESIENISSGNQINNQAGATFESTGATGTSTGAVPVSNLGTVSVSRGTLTLGSVAQVSSGTLTAGTWNATGTGKLTLPGGNLTENEGSITLSGTGSFPQIDALNDNAGSLSLLGGDSLTVVPTGGSLASPGSITLGPGSTLAVTGTATLSAPSTLNVQVGGTPLSGQFGQLNVSGAATMAGTLNVALAAGYSPVVGQTYQIVSSPTLSGSFSTINVPTDASSNPVFSVTTGNTNVTLNALVTATAVVPSGNPAIYTAGGPAVTVDPGVTAASSDPNLTGATVAINNLQTGDTLHFINQNGISGVYSSGVLTLSGTATVAQYTAALQSVTFSSTGTSTVTRNLSIVAIDNSVDTIAAPETVIVDAPITITAAYVAGSAWASSFDSYLASHTNAVTGQLYGNATLGYALQTGSSAAQTQTLPWTNINTITVTFSGPVSGIGLSSLKLNGGSGGSTPTVTGIAQDSSNTYSWTLSGPLTNNRYAFGVASTGSSFGPAVVDSRGAGISGTFATGQAFPSGNGLAGSTFDFFFDVLPGDTNRDSQDTATDINNIRPLASGTRTTSASYNPYYDLLGAGIINATTLNTVRALTGRLESANPTAPSDSQGVGTTGFVGLELGAQETGSATSVSAGSSPASTVSNVESALASTSTTSVPTNTAGGNSGGAASSTTGDRNHSRQSFAAVDEAVSDFDLSDLYA